MRPARRWAAVSGAARYRLYSRLEDDPDLAQLNDVFVAACAGTQELACAVAEPLDSGIKVWVYASVIDATTGDPTTIPVEVR